MISEVGIETVDRPCGLGEVVDLQAIMMSVCDELMARTHASIDEIESCSKIRTFRDLRSGSNVIRPGRLGIYVICLRWNAIGMCMYIYAYPQRLLRRAG